MGNKKQLTSFSLFSKSIPPFSWLDLFFISSKNWAKLIRLLSLAMKDPSPPTSFLMLRMPADLNELIYWLCERAGLGPVQPRHDEWTELLWSCISKCLFGSLMLLLKLTSLSSSLWTVPLPNAKISSFVRNGNDLSFLTFIISGGSTYSSLNCIKLILMFITS